MRWSGISRRARERLTEDNGKPCWKLARPSGMAAVATALGPERTQVLPLVATVGYGSCHRHPAGPGRP